MTVRPSGTVTFLFTDVEGSTRRWEADPEAMRDELGLPVRWDPETGTYRIEAETPSGEPRPEGTDLALLYRAIALEAVSYTHLTLPTSDLV